MNSEFGQDSTDWIYRLFGWFTAIGDDIRKSYNHLLKAYYEYSSWR
jgi:hypothetical protein